MPRRPRTERAIGVAALAAVAAAAATFVAAPSSRPPTAPAAAPSREWRAVFGARPSRSQGERAIVVLSTPSVADRVAAARKPYTPQQERRWAANAEAAQRLLLNRLRRRGVKIVRDYVYTRVLDGFSAALDARARAELERAGAVIGIYPVRTVFAASVSGNAPRQPYFGLRGGHRPGIALPGYDGSGITVALLDSGIQLEHPYLHGRVDPGVDVLDRDESATPTRKPDEPSQVEAHATRMAGIVVGRDGPRGLHGVAPGVNILPIRILGWQRADDGSYALLGRGDVLLAGLERAVDPDRDGDTSDAARIALAAVTEPYAAFADSPESRAVAGASVLGTLVVAPAGNDGAAGAGFGNVSAPGAAPDALTAGAVDARRRLVQTRAVLRVGLDTALDEQVRLLGQLGVGRPVSLDVVPVRHGDALAEYLDRRARSLVAGKAALVPADGGSLEAKARSAAAAGASMLLVYGTALAGGALDLDEAAGLPVVAIPAKAGRAAVTAGRRGSEVSVSLTQERFVANGGAGHVAPFSSRGLAFDGRVKPDVVAPSIAISTADVGAAPDGKPAYATVTGTSVAAAVTAAAAALVAQARPDLSAAELRSVLVGGARPLVDEAVTGQGAGLIDPDRAVHAELAADPAALALGRSGRRAWRTVRTIRITNVSSRPLRVRLEVERGDRGRAKVRFAAEPGSIRLRPGKSGRVAIAVSAPRGIRTLAWGDLVLRARRAPVVRIPWAIAPRPHAARTLLAALQLSHSRFAPSAAAPAIVAFRAGGIVRDRGGESIEPIGQLDLELWRGRKRLGLLARERDLLPGRYAFGLTGRGPAGKRLQPGRYELRLTAHAVDSGDGTTAYSRTIGFAVTRR
jgi:subtilisin family serine protease